jgi:hypothetical protein
VLLYCRDAAGTKVASYFREDGGSNDYTLRAGNAMDQGEGKSASSIEWDMSRCRRREKCGWLMSSRRRIEITAPMFTLPSWTQAACGTVSYPMKGSKSEPEFASCWCLCES